MVTKLDTKQDFRNVLEAIKAQPIQLSKYGRKRDPKYGVIIYEDLNFTRRTRYKHSRDKSVIALIAALEYVKSGHKEYFVQLQYTTNGMPKTMEYTTTEKRSRIDYYLKKNNFVMVK